MIERISGATILSRSVWLAMVLFIMALPAAAVTVTVDGTTYELSGVRDSYPNNAALLSSQPWWGVPALAQSIAAAYAGSDTPDMNADFGAGQVLFATSVVSTPPTSVRVVEMSEFMGPGDIYINNNAGTSWNYNITFAIATSVSSPSSVPEINAGTLSQVFLILFALWLVVRRRESSTQAQ